MRATVKPTAKKAKLPSTVFLGWYGILVLPHFFPIKVDAESPKSKIKIAALATAILNWNRINVKIIPIKK